MEKEHKSVWGYIPDDNLSALYLVIVKQVKKKDIPGLTDSTVSQLLGSKS